jgi:uncharacterized repeat protein (TIGR01451 family)
MRLGTDPGRKSSGQAFARKKLEIRKMNALNLRCTMRGIVVVLVLAALALPALAQSPNFPDFSNAANQITVNGSASLPGTVLQLNTATADQNGSAWFNTAQSVANGFSTTFKFQITNGSQLPGDGLAFVIQNVGTSALEFIPEGQSHGEGIGYETITNSLAVEFDTFQNSTQHDPDNNHVAVQSCAGGAPNSPDHGGPCKIAVMGLPNGPFFTTGTHTVRIDYNPPFFQVNLDGTDLFTSANGNLINSLDLASRLGLGQSGTAFVGFTGSTGASVEENDILSWTFTSHTSTSQTQPISPGQTTTFNFGTYNYAITPDPGTNQNTNQLTIDAVLVDPGNLNDGTPKFNPIANAPGPNFPGATCFVYQGTGGHCVEFHANCNGSADCLNGFYNLATTFNKPTPGTIQNSNSPGLLMAPGSQCASNGPPKFDPPFSRNIFTGYDPDPIVKGKGGPGYSCFVAVENVTYQPADLALLNVASSKIKTGNKLTYVMALVNLGPNTANAVNVTFPVPTGTTLLNASFANVACTLSFNGITCSPPPQGVPCTVGLINNVNTATCNIGVLAPFTLKNLNGAAIVANVTVNAPAGSKITNTATASAINPDPKTGNNTSTAVTSVTP